jgi:transposase
MSTITETVQALKDAKNESGLQQVADQTIEAVRAGLRATWAGKLETIQGIQTIQTEGLYHFAKMPNGKPYAGWKPLVRAIFKKAIDEANEAGTAWDKGTRNSWAVTLVDLGMSQAEAGDTLNVSQPTVARACKDAELEAEGKDPEAERKATRKAQEGKSDSDKLEDALKTLMGSISDRGRWTTAQLVVLKGVMADATVAIDNELPRREDKPARSVAQGQQGRTGQKASA